MNNAGKNSHSLPAPQPQAAINAQSLQIIGTIAAQSGRYDEAVKIFNQAIKLNKKNPQLFYDLGVTFEKWGKPDEALLKYKKAVALKPDYIEAHIGIGSILKEQGRLDEAELKYKRVIALKPDHADAHNNLGIVLRRRGQLEAAVACYHQAIKFRPDYVDAHNNLGNALQDLGHLDAAVTSYRRALEINPAYAKAYNNLGTALQTLGKLDDAVASFRQALQINPVNAEAYSNLGSVLKDLGQLDDTVASYRKALEINPAYAEAYYNLGNAQQGLGQLDEAVASFRRALEMNPAYAKAHNNLGTALQDIVQLDDAVASFRQALQINPVDAEACNNLASVLLMSGMFSEGWQKYESRWEAWKGSTPKIVRPATQLPQWTGQSISQGDRLLIFSEQGFGDRLQFSRYIPLAAECFSGRVSVVVNPPLQGLFHRSFPGVEILEAVPADQSAWQWHCPLLSLPLAFGTVLENIPGQSPYLVPDPARIAGWKSKISALELSAGTRKIGVVWKPGKGMKIAKLKALAFQQLAPLLEQPGCAWFSLQKEPDPDNTSGRLIDWTNELNDFDDTAALMMNLDLIISVDTSVAHLAGGLGLPTWLFNRHASDWRWMRGREDSPWYPTMRIFTQETAGDWDGVTRRMIGALSK